MPEIKEIDRDGTEEFLVLGCDDVWEREYEKDASLLLEKFKKSLD